MFIGWWPFYPESLRLAIRVFAAAWGAQGCARRAGFAIAVLQNVSVIVGEFLSMLSGVIGTKLDGIVGDNYLRAFRVVINCPEGYLTA